MFKTKKIFSTSTLHYLNIEQNSKLKKKSETRHTAYGYTLHFKYAICRGSPLTLTFHTCFFLFVCKPTEGFVIFGLLFCSVIAKDKHSWSAFKKSVQVQIRIKHNLMLSCQNYPIFIIKQNSLPRVKMCLCVFFQLPDPSLCL